MIVSGAAKPSSKVLSLVCFSISFFNYSTKEEKNEEPCDRCIGCVKKKWFKFELCIKSCHYKGLIYVWTKYLCLMSVGSEAWVTSSCIYPLFKYHITCLSVWTSQRFNVDTIWESAFVLMQHEFHERSTPALCSSKLLSVRLSEQVTTGRREFHHNGKDKRLICAQWSFVFWALWRQNTGAKSEATI